jgi:ssDNA-binding Zn-finger/Zn-ribbon topoisomerase 1
MEFKMVIDLTQVSSWYVRLKGFHVYDSCPACQGLKISYMRARKKGYHGFAAQCADCGHRLPTRFKHHHKTKSVPELSACEGEENLFYLDDKRTVREG